MLVCTGVYTFGRPGLGLQNPERIEKKRIETAQIEGDENFDGFVLAVENGVRDIERKSMFTCPGRPSQEIHREGF